ncbi:hypothetical protein [Pseudoduganella aquatica]|uniref:hypothetical protein n=1 Tax=Pseudoduganella aquatica TaxID=2660641 RepID=UPI001E622F34|nr:hypothetical protein [Pseudoduganella aquatica]
MLRRIVPLLIAYLLLMSQQVAMSHGYTHWTPAQKTIAGELLTASGATSDSPVVDHICLQCVAAAELAFAINGSLLRFEPQTSKPLLPALLFVQARERFATVVFQSRAPPVL